MSPLPDIVPDLCDAIVLQLHFLEHVPAFPQKIAATDDNSALREDMRALEPEEENAQPRTLRWVPLGFLGKIGPRHHANSWHLSLWRTAITLAHVKVTQVLPRRTTGWSHSLAP